MKIAIAILAIATWLHPNDGFQTNPTRTAFAHKRIIKTKSLQSSRNNEESINGGAAACGGYSVRDSFNLIVLGDLHIEDDMSFHNQAQSDCLQALEKLSLLPTPPSDKRSSDDDGINVETLLRDIGNSRAGELSVAQLEMILARKKHGNYMNSHVISLGDLGRKEIRGEEGDPGTTKSFLDSKSYLENFGVPYDLVTGNHDLEGLDEFPTDSENLEAWLRCFDKEKPYFSREVGDRTLLVGLSTVRFRDAPYSSHECHVDDEQLAWFLGLVERHPDTDGWKIIVFTHAPIMGSGLRVLQGVHVVNGCAWLNHCSPNRDIFIRTVKNNPQIKLWFSGHFHLSHDYQDSISTVGSCTFVQVGVIGQKSTRDDRRQTRIVQGTSDRMKIYTVNHHKRVDGDRAEIRLDAEIDLVDGEVKLAHGHQDYDHDNWFSAYIPSEEDGCYIEIPDGQIACQQTVSQSVCWWHMSDGAVLGLHGGQLVEYDKETLSPLGIVCDEKQIDGREVLVVEEGTAVVLVDGENLEVVHPNEDGSYWRKFQKNKKVRQEEKAREAIAKLWLQKKR